MQHFRVLYRFLIGYLILHLIMAGIFVVVVSRGTRRQMIVEAQSEMQSLARMLSSYIRELPEQIDDPAVVDFLKQVGTETQFRYTVINEHGAVLADSEKGIEDIGPHGTRPEILQAGKGEVGFSERFSTTLETPMMYLAIPFRETSDAKSSGFIRVAAPAVSINQSINQLQYWMWFFALAFSVVTGLVMSWFTSRVLEPLSQFAETARRIGSGSLDQPIPLRNRNDEWGDLADAFGQMQNELANRETNLVENNQRVQAVLGSMIEGVLSTATDGSVAMANNAACQMLAVSHVELIEKNLLDVVRYPEFRKAIESAREKRSMVETEFETIAEPRRMLKARVCMLPNESEGIAIVLHDVTDLRALENMRRDFVSNVSHELKTPLASIKATAETLSMGAINDTDRNLEFVNQIEAQADLLNHQIQDLIELARIESGNATAEVNPTPLNRVCQKCIKRLLPEATRCEVSLVLEASDQNPMALADEDGIVTILTNLLSNAIHYTPANGSVKVQTSIAQSFVVIEVIDTGIGIAVDHQSRVFERFYRIDKARSRDLGGTGLGLSIVKHLTQSFGGTVQLKSQVGKGSTFRVELPKAPPVQPN